MITLNAIQTVFAKSSDRNMFTDSIATYIVINLYDSSRDIRYMYS